MDTMSFDQIVELVERLPPQQQRTLLVHLLGKSQTRQLTNDERKSLFESMIVDLGAISSAYSDRREDWYDDDGR
jgi:hypothetical protein